MVKLFKTALSRVIGDARRKLSLIELQTFVSDAVQIVNDRPLTSVSSATNDLTPYLSVVVFGSAACPPHSHKSLS